jgi:putative heme-binding domain-containing protein
MSGEGSTVGPDLSNVGRRYSTSDLARAIVTPSDEVPDMYRQTVFQVGGRTITGRVTNMTAATISVSTDPRDPAKAEKLRRTEIQSQKLSSASTMPGGLLNTLSGDEIASLFRFLQSGLKSESPSVPSPDSDSTFSAAPRHD